MGQYIRLDGTANAGQDVICSGAWTAANAPAIEKEVAETPTPAGTGPVRLDLTAIDNLDTIGAWLLTRYSRAASKAGRTLDIQSASEQHRKLLSRIGAVELKDVGPGRHGAGLMTPFVLLGRSVTHGALDLVEANSVQGRVLAALGRTLTFRARWRFASFVTQFQQIILGAIPIVVLISLVVGAIITQQTILQLRNFGATIFVVDLAAILMFREIGILMAAIMVAGRSGSAITAELGAMRMREEFDALKVMGVDPYQALILPRIAALLIGMPILTFVASMAGLFGSALVAQFYGGITTDIYLGRLQNAMSVTSVAVGLIKAPFMAMCVGLIASIEGMRVEGSTDSLGRHTTTSVVKSIFVVILADGLFAMFFAAIRF